MEPGPELVSGYVSVGVEPYGSDVVPLPGGRGPVIVGNVSIGSVVPGPVEPGEEGP